MPFAGVEVAHFWIVERLKTKIETKGIARIIAWIVTGTLSWKGLIPLGVIDNLTLSIVLYLALFYGIERPLLKR